MLKITPQNKSELLIVLYSWQFVVVITYFSVTSTMN